MTTMTTVGYGDEHRGDHARQGLRCRAHARRDRLHRDPHRRHRRALPRRGD
ncbi:MAG: two pore domain potassium channel family protein [Actinobacteria bacterium]|nr:two pore domain potassium channel family protein [Actinomycetota bacterium]